MSPEATHAFGNPFSHNHRVPANGAVFYLKFDRKAAVGAHDRVAGFFRPLPG